MPLLDEFPVVAPLLARHAEDAAFYWSQLDNSAYSLSVYYPNLSNYNRLLDTHLDGLHVARRAGWPPAKRALERWKKPGEAFVCTALALRSGSEDWMSEVLSMAIKRPDELLRGIISALAREEAGQTANILRRWSAPGAAPVAQVAVLRATALAPSSPIETLSAPLRDYLRSASPFVRAAACRVAARGINDEALASLLHAGLVDNDLTVRAEAAIALGRFKKRADAAEVLQQCVLSQAHEYGEKTGWWKIQSGRRLKRWVRHLAWQLPLGSKDAVETQCALPPRMALSFALCHGNPSSLATVVQHMSNPEVARYAGWVWQSLTGIDIQASGYVIQESRRQFDGSRPISDVTTDSEHGLPLPDVDAIRQCMAARLNVQQSAQRILLGTVPDLNSAAELLAQAPQAIRQLAVDIINRTKPAVFAHARASAAQQEECMAMLAMPEQL